MTHVDPKVNAKLFEVPKQKYESIFEERPQNMTVNCGNIHKYLGMTIYYMTKGLCKTTTFDYIKEILETFDNIDPKANVTKTIAPPNNLFFIRDDCTKLNTKNSEQFHKVVAKICFATKRARPHTGTSISYLKTRAREPDKDDWSKMKHLMNYIRRTKELPLILGANGTGMLKWWINGSYGVHTNLRGHSEGRLCM